MDGTPRPKARQYPSRDLRWMEQRGRTWYAIQAVPRPLRAKLGGKKRLIKSLGTRDYYVAISRRHAALAEFHRLFEQALGVVAADDLTAAALEWRDTLARLLGEQADDIEIDRGTEAARTFAGIDLGTATPLLHVDAWLREASSPLSVG